MLPFSNNYFEAAYNSWFTVTFQSETFSNTYLNIKETKCLVMFFSCKVLRINNWTDKINKNLYNKHSVTYTAQYIEHIYINSGGYKLGEALINYGVCLGGPP